jgi:hypothetical protein
MHSNDMISNVKIRRITENKQNVKFKHHRYKETGKLHKKVLLIL